MYLYVGNNLKIRSIAIVIILSFFTTFTMIAQIEKSQEKVDLVFNGIYSVTSTHRHMDEHENGIQAVWEEIYGFNVTTLIKGNLNIDYFRVHLNYVHNDEKASLKEGQKYKVSLTLTKDRVKELRTEPTNSSLHILKSHEIKEIITINK